MPVSCELHDYELPCHILKNDICKHMQPYVVDMSYEI